MMIKANKAKVQKKDAKKTVKKDLEKSLTEEFLEVIKRLGHDAVHIAADISKASKSFAKKLTKAIAAPKDISKKKPEGKLVKEEIPKGVLKARKALKKASKTSNPIIQSVKVSPILSEEKAASAIKPKVSQKASESKRILKSNKEEPTPAKAVFATKTIAPTPVQSILETKSKTPTAQTKSDSKKSAAPNSAAKETIAPSKKPSVVKAPVPRKKAEGSVSSASKAPAIKANESSKESPIVKSTHVLESQEPSSAKSPLAIPKIITTKSKPVVKKPVVKGESKDIPVKDQ